MNSLKFFHEQLAHRYGCAMRRIPLDLGLGCPNRNQDGRGGCIFCTDSGARAGHLHRCMPLPEQVAAGIVFAQAQYQAKPPYIAYFQAYTSTNAPAEVLQRLFQEALACAEFPVAIISTRPDCLPQDTVELLAEMNQTREIWVELGVQTSCNQTLDFIHRGHHFDAVQDAVLRLNRAGIKTAAHLILGLPGETRETWRKTANDISALPFSAIKMHHLQVLKNTVLEDIYQKKSFPVLNEFEYADALAFFLLSCRDDLLLMRLCSEAPASGLIAPRWHLDKNQFHEMFRAFFNHEESQYLPVQTADGSWTLYHPAYKQHFHSMAGAAEESYRKYLSPCHIHEKLENRENVSVLEVGFGLGFNSAALMKTAENAGKGFCKTVSLELDPTVISSALSLPDHPDKTMLTALHEHRFCKTAFGSISFVEGDARQTVKDLENESFDFVLLDAFSPEENPELWTMDFLSALVSKMKPNGLLATYSTAYPLLGAAQKLNLYLYASEPFGRKRPGLILAKQEHPELTPFPAKECAIASSCTVGIPWRDPNGTANREEIIAQRKAETAAARAAGMPKWLKNTEFILNQTNR